MQLHRSIPCFAAISIAALACTACIDSESASANPLSGPDNSSIDRLNDKSTYYYLIDTVQHQVRLHSTAQCKMITGAKYEWDTSADINSLLYNYTFSGDTLYLKHYDESVLVRTSGTPGSLDGTWKVVRYYNGLGYEVPGESSGLTANRLITISGDKFDETSEIASTFDWTNTMGFNMSLDAIINTQDGMSNGPGEASSNHFIESGNTDNVAYMATMLHEFTIINRTTTSLEFARKGRTFLMEIVNPRLGSTGKSVTYRISTNGLTCSSTYESFYINEYACDWNVPEPLAFSNSDGFIYNAEKINRYDFDRCFQSLFK